MLLIGNLNLFVYFGINEGIQILTMVILAIVTVVYGLFLAIVPWEFIGGPFCSADENGYCWNSGGEESCKVFGLSIDEHDSSFLCFFCIDLSRFYESMEKSFKDCLFDTS